MILRLFVHILCEIVVSIIEKIIREWKKELVLTFYFHFLISSYVISSNAFPELFNLPVYEFNYLFTFQAVLKPDAIPLYIFCQRCENVGLLSIEFFSNSASKMKHCISPFKINWSTIKLRNTRRRLSYSNRDESVRFFYSIFYFSFIDITYSSLFVLFFRWFLPV